MPRSVRVVALAITAVLANPITASAETAAPEAVCDGRTATIVGIAGDDELLGGSGDDVIVGLGGNDHII